MALKRAVVCLLVAIPVLPLVLSGANRGPSSPSQGIEGDSGKIPLSDVFLVNPFKSTGYVQFFF